MKMKISILIVDEENSARLRFKNLVSDYSFIETVDESSNGLDAIKKINTLNPDVVYLDTKINDMTGFDIIEKITLPKKPIFIFTASSNEHAVKAFDYFAFDYL